MPSSLNIRSAAAVAEAVADLSDADTRPTALAAATDRPELKHLAPLNAWELVLELAPVGSAGLNLRLPETIRSISDVPTLLWAAAERFAARGALVALAFLPIELSAQAGITQHLEVVDLLGRLAELGALEGEKRLDHPAVFEVASLVASGSAPQQLQRLIHRALVSEALAYDWPGEIVLPNTPVEPRPAVLDLGEHRVRVVQKDGTWHAARDHSAEEAVALTELEAAELTSQPLDKVLSRHGLDERGDELREDLAAIRSQWDNDQLAVFVDSSTLHNAHACLHGRVTAWNLLDLATVTHAIVTSDVVLVNFNGRDLGEPASLSPDTLAPVYFRYSVHKQDIWDICLGAIADAERAIQGEGETLGSLWKTYLNLPYPPRVEPWSRFVQYEDSYLQTWSGLPGYRYRQPSPLGELDPRAIGDLASILTIRTWFNDYVAGLVGVPYLPSAIRGGVHQRLLQRKLEQRHILDALIARVGPAPPGDIEGASGYARAMSLPLLLGLVLSRLERPADYPAVVADFRAELEPLRRKVARDRLSADENPGRFLERYAAYFRDVTASLPGTATDGSAVIGTALAPVVGVPPGVGSGLAKIATSLGGQHLVRAYNKLFRNDVHSVSGLASAARGLRSVGSEVERVFTTQWSRTAHNELERLARLPDALFVRLRSLER